MSSGVPRRPLLPDHQNSSSVGPSNEAPEGAWCDWRSEFEPFASQGSDIHDVDSLHESQGLEVCSQDSSVCADWLPPAVQLSLDSDVSQGLAEVIDLHLAEVSDPETNGKRATSKSGPRRRFKKRSGGFGCSKRTRTEPKKRTTLLRACTDHVGKTHCKPRDN